MGDPDLPTLTPDPADEGRHPPGDERLWGESWYYDFVTTDGATAGYVRVGLYPNLRTLWYWACLVRPTAAQPLVAVIDHDVPIPAEGGSVELRTEGLWADHIVETPLDHVTVGLEAFGVALDRPETAYGDLRGERTALGFDLEWETDRQLTFAYPLTTRYEISCTVHGEVLVGDERLEIDAVGQTRSLVGCAGLVGAGVVLGLGPARRRHQVPRLGPASPGGVGDRLHGGTRRSGRTHRGLPGRPCTAGRPWLPGRDGPDHRDAPIVGDLDRLGAGPAHLGGWADLTFPTRVGAGPGGRRS